ncbi:DUF6733 family protein [Gemmatimonas sp.]|uniref:DUF6733 family protein n=1 Tax=Gemmatimonas sp. TaxID=1962908 RepID=UPI0037C013B0
MGGYVQFALPDTSAFARMTMGSNVLDGATGDIYKLTTGLGFQQGADKVAVKTWRVAYHVVWWARLVREAFSMRGADQPPSTMFSDVSIEDRIPADHPLRRSACCARCSCRRWTRSGASAS